MSFVHRWLGIQSFKHDGSIHRYWDRGLVLEDNDDFIVVASKRTKVIENNGRRWFTKEPAVTIFSKKEWWNVICMIKKDGICYYCNIASPCVVDKENIRYIDYDLDAKLFPNKDIKVLDEKEYANHLKLFGYTEDLDTVLKYQTDQILKSMKAEVFPFVDEKIFAYYESFQKQIKKD